MGSIGPETLGRLFDDHAGPLTLYARQWCGDSPEDVVQEAFARLARQPALPDRPAAWLYRVVRNGAIAAARTARRRRDREARASAGESWFAATDDAIDAGRAVERLADLDQETRAVIVARLWGGLTFEEVARLHGCSLTTAHRRYRDGLARLQAMLEPTHVEPTA